MCRKLENRYNVVVNYEAVDKELLVLVSISYKLSMFFKELVG